MLNSEKVVWAQLFFLKCALFQKVCEADRLTFNIAGR